MPRARALMLAAAALCSAGASATAQEPTPAREDDPFGKLIVVERGTAVDGDHRFRIELSCPPSDDAGRCRGDLNVFSRGERIAGRTFAVTAGSFQRVQVYLHKPGWAKLLRRERLPVRVAVRSRGYDGKLRDVSPRMDLIAPIRQTG
jgi:hypothetical protein